MITGWVDLHDNSLILLKDVDQHSKIVVVAHNNCNRILFS